VNKARTGRAGLVLAVGSAAIFFGLAFAVTRGAATSFDHMTVDAFAALSTPATDAFFRAVTWLGSGFVLIPALALIGLVLAARRLWADAILLAGIYAGASLTTWLLKWVFERERPRLHAALVEIAQGDWSFPSSHATQSAAFALGLWLLVAHARPHWRLPAGLALGALALLVAASRLHLQVHWPSDLLGGWLVALFWAGTAAASAGRFREKTP